MPAFMQLLAAKPGVVDRRRQWHLQHWPPVARLAGKRSQSWSNAAVYRLNAISAMTISRAARRGQALGISQHFETHLGRFASRLLSVASADPPEISAISARNATELIRVFSRRRRPIDSPARTPARSAPWGASTAHQFTLVAFHTHPCGPSTGSGVASCTVEMQRVRLGAAEPPPAARPGGSKGGLQSCKHSSSSRRRAVGRRHTRRHPSRPCERLASRITALAPIAISNAVQHARASGERRNTRQPASMSPIHSPKIASSEISRPACIGKANARAMRSWR